MLKIQNLLPSPGNLTEVVGEGERGGGAAWMPPGGPLSYDPMIAKVHLWGEQRASYQTDEARHQRNTSTGD